MTPEYQQSIAGQGFQAELPSGVIQGKEKSSAAKFFKTVITIILVIGGIIMLLPVLAIIFCLIVIAASSFLSLPLLNTMSVGTLFLTGFTLYNNKRVSKKYLPVLIFAMVFSLLFLAGQYNVDAVCSPYIKYQVSNLFMPLTQLFVSVIGIFGFCYNESFLRKIKIAK
tara:strand:+ start:2717 stop:3220 length:504 start_codon:yes stop_codon:yes gene_type:complete